MILIGHVAGERRPLAPHVTGFGSLLVTVLLLGDEPVGNGRQLLLLGRLRAAAAAFCICWVSCGGGLLSAREILIGHSCEFGAAVAVVVVRVGLLVVAINETFDDVVFILIIAAGLLFLVMLMIMIAAVFRHQRFRRGGGRR